MFVLFENYARSGESIFRTGLINNSIVNFITIKQFRYSPSGPVRS